MKTLSSLAKLTTLLLAASLTLAYAQDISWYSGKQSPYRVSTAAQLDGIQHLVNSGTDSFSDKTILLENDISLSGYNDNNWMPIGNSSTRYFSGTFDGQGHTISGLEIIRDLDYVGLFGYVYDGQIKNVNVVGGSIIARSTQTDCYIGGLVGRYATTKPIENSSLQAEIVNGNLVIEDGRIYIGGLAGMVENAVSISNSYAKADVRAAGSMRTSYSGGLVGCAMNYNSTIFTINNSYASGNVSSFTDGSSSYSGGLLGSNHCTDNASSLLKIINSYASGDVSSSIYNNISINRNGKVYAGGLVGYVYDISSNNFNTYRFVHSYASGKISTKDDNPNGTTRIYHGGLFGHFYKGARDTISYVFYKDHQNGVTNYSTGIGTQLSVNTGVGAYIDAIIKEKPFERIWDYDNIWDIVPGFTYPYLRAFPPPEYYISLNSIEAEHIYDQTYTGNPITPNPKIKLNGTLLNEGSDYTLTYEDNKNTGTGKIIIAGGGSFIETLTFNILPKTLAINNAAAQSRAYDGTTTATITGTLIDVEADDNVSIGTGEFADKDAGSSKAVSNVKLAGTAANNYRLTQPSGLTANITKKPVTITLNPKIIMLGRSEEMPDFADMLTYTGLVSGESSNLIIGTTAVSGTGYTHGSSPAGDYPITLSGVRSATNYEPSYDNTGLKLGVRDYGSLTDSRDGKIYRTITVNGKTWMATNLNLDEDGSRCYAENTGANNAACDRDGRLYGWEMAQDICPAGWHLPNVAEWESLAKSADPDFVSSANNTAGAKLKAMFNWNDNGNGTDVYGFSAFPGGHGIGTSWGGRNTVGYWWTNERIGTSTEYYRVAMSASADNANTRGNAPKEYFCSVRCVKSTDLSTCEIPDISAQPYSAEQITPEFSVECEGKTLVKDTDYTVEYGENLGVLAGGSITIAGTNRHNETDFYSGSVQKTFDITPKALTVSDAQVETKIYDGTVNAEITGAVLQDVYEIDIDEVSLENLTGSFASANAGTDIPVVSNMALAGTAASNYSLTQPELAGSILAKALPENAIQTIASQTHAGSDIIPNIVLKDGSKTLVENVDYTLVITDNLDVGTASVSAEGIGNYTGTLTAGFTITPKSIEESMVTSIPNQQYTGSAVEPDVVIVHGSKTLVKDVDYTLSSYSKNIEDQDASVTITGKGNYSGVLTASFKISLPKFVDSRDSKGYNIAKIGNQIWFAENLNYNASSSRCFSEDQTNCDTYGRLYTLNMAKSACPSGWHLPDRDEWRVLQNFAGGSSTAGKKLKAKSGWREAGNGPGTDDYGFAALPGGFRSPASGDINLGNIGYWWSSTEFFGLVARYNDDSFSITESSDGRNFYSVRCLYDKPNLDKSLFPELSSSSNVPSSSSVTSSSSSLSSSSSNGTPSSSSVSSSSRTSSSSRSSSSGGGTPILLPQIATANQALKIHNGINLQAKSDAVVEVFNLNGNLLIRQNFASGVYTVSLGHLPKGMYIVKVSFGGTPAILRIPVM